MNRRLLSGAVVFCLAAWAGSAAAFETGGEQIAPVINISPMTAAIVQAAQARVFGATTQQQLPAGTAPAGSTGNPAVDRQLGASLNPAVAGQQTLLQQLAGQAQAFAATPRGSSGLTFGPGATGNGVIAGGIPVISTVNNVTNVTNQRGVFNTVTATTNITGNGNTAVQSVGGIGNGGAARLTAPQN